MLRKSRPRNVLLFAELIQSLWHSSLSSRAAGRQPGHVASSGLPRNRHHKKPHEPASFPMSTAVASTRPTDLPILGSRTTLPFDRSRALKS